MSVIHRAMQDCWWQLATDVGIEVKSCMSYSQLKRIIRSIDVESFNAINVEYFGSAVARQGQHWYSVDGKELCAGRPDPEHRRGTGRKTHGTPPNGPEPHQSDGPQGGQSKVVGLRRQEGIGKARGGGPLRAGRAAEGRLQLRRAAHLPAQPQRRAVWSSSTSAGVPTWLRSRASAAAHHSKCCWRTAA